ncbi:LytTR family DNA-binding domain-containing protein [Flavobacterium sp. NKUCC04_CG]|uniref:LytR/AlgR family response regulator transcription factor n=1 Tax=Flavobacterium sp. NKUCC04_CG TaxID=2842121 RepID=UPI001C5A951A|nr:LytTR family DNA-binding domain-containing protein [Flavobacterium sp. NKUCC04_CG]MBW3520436.1 LytTR family DNA-binding domain-containing protein [Flavobacterium sp. NKUCC04_CG]
MICIIIDDEPIARAGLKLLIEEISTLEVVAKFANAHAAIDFLINNKVDLIFVDIEMPGLSGLEFVEKINHNTLTIFTTAYSQYAIKSYELQAIDYLLKPIHKERLLQAIEKAQTYLNYQNSATLPTAENEGENYIFIKSERKFFKVLHSDIHYIEGLKDYCIVHTSQQKLITAMNLKSISQKMKSNDFIRVSKSYVINMQHITSFDKHNVYMNTKEIPIGDIYKKPFFKKYTGSFLNDGLTS